MEEVNKVDELSELEEEELISNKLGEKGGLGKVLEDEAGEGRIGEVDTVKELK